jgi:hypothetical protein
VQPFELAIQEAGVQEENLQCHLTLLNSCRHVVTAFIRENSIKSCINRACGGWGGRAHQNGRKRLLARMREGLSLCSTLKIIFELKQYKHAVEIRREPAMSFDLVEYCSVVIAFIPIAK